MFVCCSCTRRLLARSAASNRAEQCPLCPDTSDFDLLSDGERIIDLDSEISDRTFHFLVAKQKLDRTQVAGATVDQGRLRAAERMRAKDVRVQSDARDPFCDEPRVLPCCHGLTNPPAAGEQKFVCHLAGRLEVVVNGLARLLRQLEADWTPGLSLAYRRTGERISARATSSTFIAT